MSVPAAVASDPAPPPTLFNLLHNVKLDLPEHSKKPQDVAEKGFSALQGA